MGATLSILGLYTYDTSLFDRLVLPEKVDKDTLIENIISECAELEVLYSDPDYMKYAIGVWSNKELPTWYRVLKTSELEYNPLYNVDATEYTKESRDLKSTETGTNVNTYSGSDTTVDNGSNTTEDSGSNSNLHKVNGFNNNGLTDESKDEGSVNNTSTTDTSNTSTTTSSNTNNLDTDINKTDTGDIITEHRRYGNIGVTMSQQLVKAELDLIPELNVMNYIIDSFKNRFCLLVY